MGIQGLTLSCNGHTLDERSVLSYCGKSFHTSIGLAVALVSALVSTLTIRLGYWRRDPCTRQRAFVKFQTVLERVLCRGFGRRKTRLCTRSTRMKGSGSTSCRRALSQRTSSPQRSLSPERDLRRSQMCRSCVIPWWRTWSASFLHSSQESGVPKESSPISCELFVVSGRV